MVVFGPTSALESRPDPHRWPPLEVRTPAPVWHDELQDAFDIVEELPQLDELEAAPDPGAAQPGGPGARYTVARRIQ